MFRHAQRGGRLYSAILGLASAALAVFVSGCQSCSFYSQAISGEYQILAHQKPIRDLIADTNTPPKLKAKFEQVMKIRLFAQDELKLPVDGAYLKYTDLHRTNVVWIVTIAPALSLEPKTWWFPIVGRASYRGYFNEADARKYAAQWEKKGWDVDVGGVDAYSTLGWFRDPLMNTFIFEPEAYLAETIFHELAHRRLFVKGDTDFNEAFAVAVSAEGLRRWFNAADNPRAYEKHREERDRERDFVRLVMVARENLNAVYMRTNLSDSEKLRRKGEQIQKLRARYAATRQKWGGGHGYDEWFAKPINNAKLNSISAYYELTPAFEALIRVDGGDMEKFYADVARLAKLPIAQRHDELRKYLEVKAPAATAKSH